MKRRHLAASVAAVIVVITAGPTAAAGDRDWQVVRHRSAITGGTTVDGGTSCDSAGQCVSISRLENAIFSGDDSGTGVQGGAVVISSTGVLAYTVTSTFVGTERHCGTGTIVYTLVGTADLNTSTILRYTADIVPGTGTGDLSGATGHFVGQTDLADPESPATSNGLLRCHRQP